jgi:hypothetical protein
MNDPNVWMAWIKVAAFICGLVFGSYAVFSPSYIWMRRQLLPVTAVVLAGFGATLVAISVRQNIDGIIFKYKDVFELQTKIDEANKQLASLSGAIGNISAIPQIQTQITELGKSIRSKDTPIFITGSDLDYTDTSSGWRQNLPTIWSDYLKNMDEENQPTVIQVQPNTVTSIQAWEDALKKSGFTDSQVKSIIEIYKSSTVPLNTQLPK